METTLASSTTEIIPEDDTGIVAGEVLSSIVGLAFLVILVKCCKSSNSGEDVCRCICGCFAEICRIVGQCFVDVTNMACKIMCSCKICENSEPEITPSRSHRRYTTEEIMRAASELSAPAPVDLPPPSYDRVMDENDNIGVSYRRSEINSTAGESEDLSIRLIEPEYSTINVDQDYPGNLVSPIPVESNVPTAPPPSYDSAITGYNNVRTDSTSRNEYENASSRIFSPEFSSNNIAEEYSVLPTASSVRNAQTDPLLPIHNNFSSHHSASPEPTAPNEPLLPTPYYAHTDYPTDRNVSNAPIEPPIRSYHDDSNTATDRHVPSQSSDPPPPPYNIVVRRNAPFRDVNYTTVVIADSPPSYEEAV